MDTDALILNYRNHKERIIRVYPCESVVKNSSFALNRQALYADSRQGPFRGWFGFLVAFCFVFPLAEARSGLSA
jgi:hypothetical protein